jgi:hypothetical protein
MGCGLSAGAVAAIGAGVGAAGSIGGSLISSGAAKSAANTQAAAAEQSAAEAQNQYTQTEANLQPYMNAGYMGLSALQGSLGLGGASGSELTANGLSGLTFQPTQAQLAATPGYQFDLNQGLQSVQNANAAQGLGVSGAALKGAAQYATGLANNTLTTQQQIFQSNLGNVLNPLESLANLGQNSAVQTGQQGIQATQNANALQVGGANAAAAGTVGSANAVAGGLSSLGSTPLNYLLYNQVLGGGGGANQNYVDNGNFS